MKFCRRLIIFFLPLILFTSCNKIKNTRFYLDDSISWAYPENGLSLESVSQLNFQKLTDFHGNNLKKLAKSKADYLWLKIEFEIPPELKYKSLGFVIPYLHFAEETYMNGTFIGSYGVFPPNEYSAQYASHFYLIPPDVIEWNSSNTIYLKVFLQGRSAISNKVFIDTYTKARNKAQLIDFLHSKIFMIFEGFLLFAAVAFLIISRTIGEDRMALRLFAQINFFTMLLLSYFFISELPLLQMMHISTLFITKLVLCIPTYWILYQIPSFILFFLNFNTSGKVHYSRLILTVGCTVVTLLMPNYSSLMKLCPLTFGISLIHVGTSISLILRGFFAEPDKRPKDVFLIAGFCPLIFSAIVDIFLREVFKVNIHIYFSVYGFIISDLTFLIYSSSKYEKVFRQNEHLTKYLSDEVKMKTVDLTFANERLERELESSAKDMDMASKVQQKFYPAKDIDFDGWELAVSFEPMNKVSGDLYDYYAEGYHLRGIGLFDVSGHGVASSLMAMLAKSIIFRAFIHSRSSGETVSTTLAAINDRVLLEKGDVQNYLTGILLRFTENSEKDDCLVELASAGHPYPLMYCASENKIVTVTHDEFQTMCGAIGIGSTNASFPNVDLHLSEGDILVLYTDGLTDVENEDKKLLGKEAIEQVLLQNHDKSTKEIVKAINSEVNNFRGDAERTDDVTFIVLKRVPKWVQ